MLNAPKKITIQKWDQFCCVCHEFSQDQNDEPIFRECKDERCHLIPSLSWKLSAIQIDSERIHEIERKFIEEFKKKWFFKAMDSYLEYDALYRMLYIMQHYGIKTRMLDWTASEYVATYFAVENNKKFDDKDTAVWCIKKGKIETRFQDICKEYEKRSQHRGKSFEFNICWDFNNEVKCPVRQPFNDQINFQCNAIFFKDVLSTATDVRMIIQASYFTYCPNPLTNHIGCITKILGKDVEKYCWKIIIPKKLKPEFRERLKQLNYIREKLFPDGFEKWCKDTFEKIMSNYQNKEIISL